MPLPLLRKFAPLLASTALCIGTLASAAHAAAPSGVQKPGTITASAPLAAALGLPDAGRALRITYLSTNGITGKGLVPVTAEIILPPGPAPKDGWPIVAWAHGTVGVDDSCAPSLNPYSDRNSTYLTTWMKRGFAIVATDYQGLGGPGTHAYLDTRVEAYSVLDSVRAALTNVQGLQNKIMIVGQSQGGGAAVATAAYAPTYAPELDIRGTVATGAPYVTLELLGDLLKNAAHPDAGYSPLVDYVLYLATGLSGHDSHFRPEEAFTPKALPLYRKAAHECLTSLSQQTQAAGLTLHNTLQPTFLKAISPALKGMEFPTLKLAQPLFTGTGTEDRDVPPALQLGLVKAACAAGSLVQAHLYKGLNHSETVNGSLADSAIFTTEVMTGKPVPPQCNPVPQ
ncbi:signal peptide-containing protein [Gluconobacter sp. DsW_056]|uniref:lipase family protein n=1 Tax=Gluconobacter sp. DsW_056 TaxID=1511209 RepID=UPI000A37E658|nr:lipase family protein [Gluconobacter sp. DsW_056]OUI82041.1 signal peptide-containing protein [Gluconobacter sp. DsW_056]